MAGELDHRVTWWRPLVQWVPCVPHNLVAGVLALLQIVVAALTAPYVVATGRVPAWVGRFHHRVLRHRASTFAFFFVLRTAFTDVPVPFDGAPARRMSRWAPLGRPFAVLPQIVLLLPVGLVLDLCYPVWMVAIAVNGGWPPALRRRLVAVEAWVVMIIAYAFLATDERPTVAAWNETSAARAS